MRLSRYYVNLFTLLFLVTVAFCFIASLVWAGKYDNPGADKLHDFFVFICGVFARQVTGIVFEGGNSEQQENKDNAQSALVVRRREH